MRWLAGFVDRLLLIACVLAAAAVPSFAQQYQQRIEGRQVQAQADLAPFQRIADRHHNGSLASLVAAYRRNDDASVRETADAVTQIINAVAWYTRAVSEMRAGPASAAQHMLTGARKADLRATWDSFKPGFGFSPDHLLFAVLGGLLVWALMSGGCRGCAHAARSLGRKPHQHA